jgi:TatD DNase family protein
MLIDSHCHIDTYSNEKILEIIENARKNDVRIIVQNGVDKPSNRRSLEITKKFPEVKVALGIYPINGLKMTEKEIEEEIDFIRKNKNKIVAIGEIGLDLKFSKELEKQTKIFEQMLDLAKELDKPVMIHCRNAEEETIKVLENKNMKKVIMHCFMGKIKFIERILENGWIFSIPTNVCYDAQMQEIVRLIPVNRIICETDSPFLEPHRKSDNEPARVLEGYKKISEIKDVKLEDFEIMVKKRFIEIIPL